MGNPAHAGFRAFSNADVGALEDLLSTNGAESWQVVHGAEQAWITFTVSTAALSDFDVLFRAHQSGGAALVASVAADYTAPEGPILGASGDLTTAAAGATVHWLHLDLRGVYAFRLRAAGTASNVTGHASWS